MNMFFDIVNVLCSIFVTLHWKSLVTYNVFIKFTLNTKSVVLKVFYGMIPIPGT